MSILYKEIAQNIVEYIHSIPATDKKLPTERDFSEMYKVSRQTIRHALDICEKNNLITRRHGSGIYLSDSYLKSQNHIAILISHADEYTNPLLLRELQKRFSLCSYSFDIYETNDNIYTQRQILKDLMQENLKCIIVQQYNTALPIPFPDLYKKIINKGTKIIFIGKPYPNLVDVSYVECDNYYSAYSIAGRVIADNRPWCAIFMSNNNDSIDKYLGFTQSMHELNSRYDSSNINWINYSDICDMRNRKDTSSIQKILQRFSKMPNNFVCNNDELAYWLIYQLNKQDQMSDDISIYSFDNSYIHTIIDHKLLSYGTDMATLATSIVEMSLNAKKEKEIITLPSSFQS